MYAYTQYRHESKKWFSRVYLLFANVLLLALAVVVMVSGYAVLKVVTDDENKFFDDNVITLTKGTAIGLLTVGSIIAVFSLVGSIGACKRHNGALKFYIFGLIVFFFVILGCGIKFIMELKANSTRWNDMSLESWKNLDNYHKDMYQIQFTCCGFDTSNSEANTAVYNGPVLFSKSLRTDNLCLDTKYLQDAPNCYYAGVAWYHIYNVVTWTVFAGLLVFLLTGIGAADQSKLRASDVGYQVVATQQGYEMYAKA